MVSYQGGLETDAFELKRMMRQEAHEEDARGADQFSEINTAGATIETDGNFFEFPFFI